MVEPVSLTGAALMAIAASKFVEVAAEKAATVLGEGASAALLKQSGTQVDAMWQRVKRHFAPNQRAAGLLAQVEAGPPQSVQSAEAFNKLAVYLDDDLAESQHRALADELRQMAQQIVNIAVDMEQQTTTINAVAKDQARQMVVGRDANGTTNFGDGPP
ncbi:MAG: hypothetical protein DCF25_04595 [Leptolyngbya foveolarum]|uniref:Uncharacterized protein n=1 Tax=Leptolyngbya foveolarum TaxID=47253 RepID=A0A2W4UR78_9CYAN|nr:MAG: hypothetical protein DCF25_04595 [Leptolyngbya foveolarum]